MSHTHKKNKIGDASNRMQTRCGLNCGIVSSVGADNVFYDVVGTRSALASICLGMKIIWVRSGNF